MRLTELGHASNVRLFDYFHAKKEPQFAGSWLIIEQSLGTEWSRGRHGVRLAVAESGVIIIDTNVTGREERQTTFSMLDIMTINLGTVSTLIGASFHFTAALYDDKDRYQRHQRFYWNTALTAMGSRTLERNLQQRNAFSMGLERKETMIAFDTAPQDSSNAVTVPCASALGQFR